MKEHPRYFVMLFKAVSCVLKAEKILQKEGLPHKLIPLPKSVQIAGYACALSRLFRVKLKPLF
jgi:Protein of unknown function (DUF3343)